MGDVSGLIADPKFQGLSPADQRTALMGVSGDKAFSSLSDDDTHRVIRGIQAKSISASPPAVPRPQVNMQYNTEPVHGIPPAIPQPPDTSFSGQIGERIKQNINLIPHIANMISGKEQASPEEGRTARELTGIKPGQSTLRNVVGATTVGPRLVYNAVKGYIQNPATAVGDIVTASPELSEMRLPTDRVPTGSTVPRPPVSMEPPLSPEQQTKYTADLDAANASYQQKAQKYAGAVTNTFDEATRQHQEAIAAHEQKVQSIQQKHAADIAQAQADFEAGTQKEQALRAAHEQKIQAAQESQRQAAAVEQQRSELGDTQGALIEQTRQRAQELAQQQRDALDARWNSMRQGETDAQGNVTKPALEEVDTPINKAVQAVTKAESTILRGAPGSLKLFKQMLNEFGFGELDEDTGEYTAGKPNAPWQTVRAQSSAMSRAMASTPNLGPVYPALKLVRDALEDSAGAVADANGRGAEFKALKNDEHIYRNDFEDMGSIAQGKGNPASRLVRAPNAAYARDQIMGKGSDLLGQALNRWDKSGDLAGNVARINEIDKQIKTLPKVKVLAEPPPYTGQPPTMQQVPEPTLPARPGIPEGRLPPAFTHPTQGTPVAPELEQVPRPTPNPPPPPEPGFILRHVPRVIGKVVGGKIGTALGHPLIGYGAGSELGSEAGRQIAARIRRMPPTPEAYHRTILEAKEGKISPGEADRRISRAGGKVKVNPLPPPP